MVAPSERASHGPSESIPATAAQFTPVSRPPTLKAQPSRSKPSHKRSKRNHKRSERNHNALSATTDQLHISQGRP
ncbi:hypothetical protein Ate02nite_24010 [Paractinoplanes tereljensis]|uniref:Uncharacterized protein n=1 Tax=Paractinoplanes tereljensis TaxID=571912 RepID=A0A919TRQ3_9ACTN|nr:hypothetical protein Ate02nite_24010 [Actinoplanes tereljensis]